MQRYDAFLTRQYQFGEVALPHGLGSVEQTSDRTVPHIVYGLCIGPSRPLSCTVCLSAIAISREAFYGLHCFADLVFGPLYVYLCNSEKSQKFIFRPAPLGLRCGEHGRGMP